MSSNEEDIESVRQANIARNKKLLESLKLNDVALEFVNKKTNHYPSPRKHNKLNTNKKIIKKEYTPTRRSARLRGVKVEDDQNENQILDNPYSKTQEYIDKSKIRNPADLKLNDIEYNNNEWKSNLEFNDYDKEFAPTIDLSKSTEEIRDNLRSLTLYSKFNPLDIKLTPERIYSTVFHPSVSHPMILCGDKVGNLGIWNIEGNKIEEDEQIPEIYTFKVHSRPLAHLLFDIKSPEKIYTASYDGSIRSVNLSSGISSEILFIDNGSGPEVGEGVTELSYPEPNILWFSTIGGRVGHIDMRESKPTYYQLHEKKIGGFCLNPNAPYLGSTASLDRTMKIWDFRNIKTDTDESSLSNFVAEYNSRLSISCTSWSQTDHVVINGYDDTINIFALNDSPSWSIKKKIDDLTPSKRIKHNCQSGRWVTILRSHWQKNPADGFQKFVIANMARSIDVYSETGSLLCKFKDELMTAVPSAVNIHPTQNWIAGGTASGKIYLYQ